MKKTARRCGATGPLRVKIVRSNRQSGELHDGSTSICLRLCSGALTQTQKPCVSVGNRRASVRHDEGPHGSDTLPHQNAPQSRGRDDALRLAYNLTRVMNIVGTKPLITAIAT